MNSHSQGTIVWASYPLTDKQDKLKRRPVLIVSNALSNALDNDVVVVPITKAIREEAFSLRIEPTDVAGDLPIQSEVRCNKPFTIRTSLIHEPLGVLSAARLEEALDLLRQAVTLDLS